MEWLNVRIFSGEKISKSYGEKCILNDVSFQILEGDKIGIIGVNGTGKSSLMKMIAGLEDVDSGEFTYPKDYKIAYLAQEPILNEAFSILDQVFQSQAPVIQLVKSYETALSQLEMNPESEHYQQQLFNVQKQMDALNGWEANTYAKTILSKLGIHDTERLIGQLSGGQKKRVALAQVLIETPDLLLMDEPTNHLDYETIKWLERFLQQYPKAVMVVTHDRYFLDQITTRIIEVDQGQLYTYQGNYESFIEAKAIREEQAIQAEEKRQNLYRRELAWMKRGAKARSTKQKARIQRFEDIEEQVGSVSSQSDIEMAFQGTRLGKQVFELVDASKSYNNKIILHQFDLLIKPKDRYGIVGTNGSGKSSFLNILSGKINLDHGKLIIGQTVKIAYYTQENVRIDEDMRMIEYVRKEGEVIETAHGDIISVTQMLEKFLFPKSTHGTFISKLSGGEKRRLYLLKLLMTKPNVLLLDEPTNDLDTETLTVLENYIEEFDGVVISVSHDRYFLDKTATQLLIFKGNGEIEKFYGSYSDYLEQNVDKNEKQPRQKQTPSPIEKQVTKRKMSYKEQQEWNTIEQKISETEEIISTLTLKLEQTGSDFEKAQELMAEIELKNEHLEHLISRWTILSELV